MEEQTAKALTQDQYLTFILDEEEYGVNILTVRAIQGWEKPTPIPNTPDYVLGVVNLRGEVVPIVDLRSRFSIEIKPYDRHTVVIIVHVVSEEKERTVGLVVDAVSEVYNIDAADLRPPPDFGGAIGSDFVRGLAMIEDKMVIILEIDNLVSVGLMQAAEDVAETVIEETATEA